MRAESHHLVVGPSGWRRLSGGAAGLLVRWLLAGVRATAFWALFYLVADAAGWGAAPAGEPVARLRWILLLGALTGAGELLADWELRRRRRSAEPPAS